MNLKELNESRDLLFDWIDEQQALTALMPGYVNGPADVDREGWFVDGGAHHMEGWL